MKRFLSICVAVFALVLVLGLMAVFVAPKTPPGRAFIDAKARPVIEQAIAEQLGSTIEFGPLDGALPGQLILTDIRLTQEDEIWLSLERAEVRWAPLALLRGEVKVREIELIGPTVTRLPTLPERDDSAPQDKPNADLPTITIDRFAVIDGRLEEPVIGWAGPVNADMAARLEGLALHLNGTMSTNADTLTFSTSSTSRSAALHWKVSGEPAGLVGTLARTEDPIDIELKGDGAFSDWQGSLNANVGEWGVLSADLSGDVRLWKDGDAALRLAVVPGIALPPVTTELVGDLAEIDLHLSGSPNDLTATFRSIQTAAFFGTGSVNFTEVKSNVTALSANVSGSLAATSLLSLGAQDLAGDVNFSLNGKSGPDGLAGDATLTHHIGSLSAKQFSQDPNGNLAVLLNADVNDLPALGITLPGRLDESLNIIANVQQSTDQSIRVDLQSATLGPDGAGLSANGQIALSADGEFLVADLQSQLSKPLINTLLGQEIATDAVGLRLKADTPIASPTLQATGTVPALTLSDNSVVPAGTFSLETKNLLTNPTVQASLLGDEDAYSGTLIGQLSEQIATLSELSFNSRGLALAGEGTFDPELGVGQLTASIDATSGATLLTGQRLRGAMTVSASTTEARTIEAIIASPSLAFDDMRVRDLNIIASGQLSALALTLDASDIQIKDQYIARASSEARLAIDEASSNLTLSSLSIFQDAQAPDQEIRLLDPVQITLSPSISIEGARLSVFDTGRATLSASMVPDQWTASADIRTVPIPFHNYILDGQVNLDTSLQDPGGLSFSLRDQRADDNEKELAPDVDITGQFASSALDLTVGLSDEEGQILQGQVGLPVQFDKSTGTVRVVVDPDAPLTGNVEIDGALGQLLLLMPEQVVTMSGNAKGQILLGGTVAQPDIDGDIALLADRITEPESGLTLQNVEGSLTVQSNSNGIQGGLNIEADDAKGRPDAVRLAARFTKPGEAVGVVDGSLTLDKATLANRSALTFEAAGDLALSGELTDMLLEGKLDIGRLDVTIPDSASSNLAANYTPITIRQIDGPATLVKPKAEDEQGLITFDLKVAADNDLFVRGRGLDSEWQADLEVSGSSAAPTVSGQVAMVRGKLSVGGRQFNLTEGVVTMDPDDVANPALSLVAEYDAGGDTAIMTTSGTVNEPSVTFTTTNGLPGSDAMALVLFGKSPTELSALELAQAANTFLQLAAVGPFGGGGGGVGGKLRQTLGVDTLSLGVDPDSRQVAVEAGKNINDRLYVGGKRSADAGGTEINVIYDLMDNVTIESTLKQTGGQSVSANYKRDY